MLLHAVYTNEIVRGKVLSTLFYLLLYLAGLNILLPLVSPELLYNPTTDSNASLADLLNTINTRSSYTHNVSIFALGILSYYLASVIAVLAIPFLYRDRKENEEAIRRLIKVLTLIIAMVQAFSYNQTITYWFVGHDAPSYSIWVNWVTLVAGALVCMWIADKISEQGLMDGRILLLCVGLFSGFPSALITEVTNKVAAGQLLQLGIEICIWGVILAGIVAFTQAVRYLPLKQEESPEVDKLTNPNLRIRLNVVDDYPLGLANQLTMLPLLIFQFSISADTDTFSSHYQLALSDPTSLLFMVSTFISVIVATYIVVRIMLGSKLREQGEGPILDIPEERSYLDYYQQVFRRLTLPLAIVLATIAILPGIATRIFDITPAFGAYFGGFSLFLIISLTTDFFSNLEQMVSDSPTVIGRSTTPDLDLAYEVEYEYEED